MTTTESRPADFIRTIVADDVRAGKYEGRVVTRFPPEPNGYLPIGPAHDVVIYTQLIEFSTENPPVPASNGVQARPRESRYERSRGDFTP